MPPFFWPAMLMLVGLALIVAEIFVPSGGMIGFLSFSSIVTAIVLAYTQSGPFAGTGFLLVACVAVPVALATAFRILPNTPVGRRLLANIPTSEEVLPDSEERRQLRELVGRVGVAKSLMLPSGAVAIDGHTIDAVSEGQPIDPGQAVRVIEVRGTIVVVSPLDAAALKEERPAGDVLSQPIDSLGLDPFEDPLV